MSLNANVVQSGYIDLPEGGQEETWINTSLGAEVKVDDAITSAKLPTKSDGSDKEFTCIATLPTPEEIEDPPAAELPPEDQPEVDEAPSDDLVALPVENRGPSSVCSDGLVKSDQIEPARPFTGRDFFAIPPAPAPVVSKNQQQPARFFCPTGFAPDDNSEPAAVEEGPKQKVVNEEKIALKKSPPKKLPPTKPNRKVRGKAQHVKRRRTGRKSNPDVWSTTRKALFVISLFLCLAGVAAFITAAIGIELGWQI